LENVQFFNALTFDIEGILPGGSEEGAACCLESFQSIDSTNFLAVGYSDGHCSLYDTTDWRALLSRGLGHKLNCRILCMAVSPEGTYMASGGSDTDIVWWDVAGQDPLFRLRGHQQAVVGVTLLSAGGSGQQVISVGAEGVVRVWDPELRACVHTFVGSETQATTLAVDITGSRLIIGARDESLRVWDTSGVRDTGDLSAFKDIGALTRRTHRPCAFLGFNPDQTLILAQAADNVIEIFRVLSESLVQKRLGRFRKRKREQGKDEGDIVRNADAEFLRLDQTIRTAQGSKIRAFCFLPQDGSRKDGAERVVVQLNDNRFETWDLTWGDDAKETLSIARARSCETIGHRGEIRGSTMASSSRQVATCAVGGVKVWRVELEEEGEEGSIVDCTHTIPLPEPVCLTFLPGDQYLAVGTKEGTIELLDLRRSCVVDTIEAHKGEVRCLCVRADQRGLATGGSDQQLRTWTFEVQRDEEDGQRRVGLAPGATLKLTDAVTACGYSADAKFLAVALQDNTVKVFFADSHKFFLSLYGHKYPVTALSFSSDSRLIATASIDKNVKIWGLDFGDCHKSLFAHDDYVTDVKFVPGTHYMWTSGKDGMVKSWDADKFVHIQTLKGHHGAVWTLELSREGGVLISCGADRTLRSWVRTEEQLFPEEEREKEAAEAADKEAADGNAQLETIEGEVGVAGQRTATHMRTSEQLQGCLDLVANELQRVAERDGHAIVSHPLLAGKSPYEYLAAQVDGIKGHDMRYTLSGLPGEHCRRLLLYSADLVEKRLVRTEVIGRICIFLCKQHAAQVGADPALRSAVLRLKEALGKAIADQVQAHAFNLAGLEFLQQAFQEKSDGREVFFDLSQRKGAKKRRQK